MLPHPRLVTALLIALVLTVKAAPDARAASAPGSAGAKAALKCQQTIVKANGKFLGQRLKRLAACSNAVLACLETQPAVAACVTKATAKCGKQFGPPDVSDAAAAKLEAAVVKTCGALPIADLLATDGLGFADTGAACAAVGVATLASAADVARCLQLLHAAVSEDAYGAELPRAAELTAQGGVSALVVPDLPVFDGCGDCGTSPIATGKALAGCGAAIGKAGAAFLAKARGGLDKCAAAFVACAETKPGDAGCREKAADTCRKLPADLVKARVTLAGALAKKCGGTLGFPLIAAPAGIDVAALACECQQVGVTPVASLDDYALCLTRQHECRLASVLPTIVPTLDGLLADQGLSVGDLLCAPPTAAASFAEGEPRAFFGLFGSISKFVKQVQPGSFRSTASPFATRGIFRRVGAPSFGGCQARAGNSCFFRFPITKKPADLQKVRGSLAAPAALVVGVQRADGTFADGHFEVPLGDTTNDSFVDVEVDYADDLASCGFDLALAVMEDGVVSNYTTVAQTPHVVPANDACAAARPITTPDFMEVLDVTAATAVDDPSCGPGPVATTVWYRFTAPANGTVTADTFGSDFDSIVAVLPGSCTGSVNGCANDSAGTLQSQLAFPVTTGTTYFIEVGQSPPARPTSTLHFNFHFERAGEPTVAKKLTSKLEELNSSRCFATSPFGSLFLFTFQYDDADGDVPTVGATADIRADFTPSGGVSNFVAPIQIDGDGFHGTGSFEVCTFFSQDTNVTTTVRLHDQLGPGLPASVDLARPKGAN